MPSNSSSRSHIAAIVSPGLRMTLSCFLCLAFFACQNPLEKTIAAKIADATDVGLEAISVSLSADTIFASATLQPAFDPEVTSYTVSGDALVCKAGVSATLGNTGASLEYRMGGGAWKSLASGTGSESLPLVAGANALEIRVTSENKATTRTYAINVEVPTEGKGSPAVLLPPSIMATGKYGYSLAMSGDASILAVGAAMRTAVEVYEKSGDAWIHAVSLTPWPALSASDAFGYSVAMTRDGKVIVVGAHAMNSGGVANNGMVYVFTRDGSSWADCSYVALTTPVVSDEFQWFGSSVAISDAGDTILVGADHNCGKAGRAYIFSLSGGTWTQAAELLSDNRTDTDLFGSAVALSGDGLMAVVGAPRRYNAGGGRVFVFTYSGSTWAMKDSKYLTTTEIDAFGNSVAIASDKSFILVGAPYMKNAGSPMGAVYLYDWNGSSLSNPRQIRPPLAVQGVSNSFGYSVSLSGDGKYAAIGDPGRSVAGVSMAGACTLYRINAGSLTDVRDLPNPHPATTDDFGWASALSGDGSKTAIAAPFRDGSAEAQGVAYVY